MRSYRSPFVRTTPDWVNTGKPLDCEELRLDLRNNHCFLLCTSVTLKLGSEVYTHSSNGSQRHISTLEEQEDFLIPLLVQFLKSITHFNFRGKKYIKQHNNTAAASQRFLTIQLDHFGILQCSLGNLYCIKNPEI